jgi:hypothetical protein
MTAFTKLAALVVLSATGLTILGVQHAMADNPFEVEASRARAKFGFVLDDRDVELLRRYGCYTSSDHPVCDTGHRDIERHVVRKKKKQRSYD